MCLHIALLQDLCNHIVIPVRPKFGVQCTLGGSVESALIPVPVVFISSVAYSYSHLIKAFSARGEGLLANGMYFSHSIRLRHTCA